MERLQKILARAGFGSRRKAERLIKQGLVTVNGEVAEIGSKADIKKDDIRVKGKKIAEETLVYYLLHKPEGYICTVSDPFDRPKVVDLLPKEPRVFPIGRLDSDTTGVLLLTNDGELTNFLLHPRYEVSKTYLAKVKGIPNKKALDALGEGLILDEGPTQPAKVQVLKRGQDSALVSLTIAEGRKRQVKRMLAAVGHEVISLHRTKFGPIDLGKLEKGCYRELTKQEVEMLRECQKEC